MSSFGACCDRCGHLYRTNTWPAASLCGRCNPTRAYPPGLVKTAEQIRGAA